MPVLNGAFRVAKPLFLHWSSLHPGAARSKFDDTADSRWVSLQSSWDSLVLLRAQFICCVKILHTPFRNHDWSLQLVLVLLLGTVRNSHGMIAAAATNNTFLYTLDAAIMLPRALQPVLTKPKLENSNTEREIYLLVCNLKNRS